MANEILKHDQNAIRVLGGITDDTNQEVRMLRVDPLTNRLLVSGTGGGGGGSGYQAPLSGGLTGTNTWTTAPNVLVIDGVPRQKTQTDGTVMWTGTTTTVLTGAPLPTFDIFASA